MVVYLDILILVTFFSNIFFIETVELITSSPFSLKRGILSSLFCVLSLLLYIYPFKKILFIRYIVGVILGLIGLTKASLKKILVKITIYYLLNLCTIGFLAIFKIHNFWFVVLTIILVIFLFFISNKSMDMEKEIIYNNRLCSILYDNGNTIYYDSLPIVILNERLRNNEYTKIGELNVKTINNENKEKIYKGPPLILNKHQYNVYYIFSECITYDIIVHRDIKEEICLNF